MAKPEWGTRRIVLNDLAPAATFIAANYSMPFDVRGFAVAEINPGRANPERDIGWMYRDGGSFTKGRQGA